MAGHGRSPTSGCSRSTSEKETNIVLIGAKDAYGDRYCNSVVVDPRDPDPAKRYKMAYYDWSSAGEGGSGTHVAFSPDGIRWTKHAGRWSSASRSAARAAAAVRGREPVCGGRAQGWADRAKLAPPARHVRRARCALRSEARRVRRLWEDVDARSGWRPGLETRDGPHGEQGLHPLEQAGAGPHRQRPRSGAARVPHLAGLLLQRDVFFPEPDPRPRGGDDRCRAHEQPRWLPLGSQPRRCVGHSARAGGKLRCRLDHHQRHAGHAGEGDALLLRRLPRHGHRRRGAEPAGGGREGLPQRRRPRHHAARSARRARAESAHAGERAEERPAAARQHGSAT